MNTKPLCKALRAPATHLGETEPGPCSQRATHGEYCHAHDPRRVEERAMRTRERVMGLARKLDADDLRTLLREKLGDDADPCCRLDPARCLRAHLAPEYHR